MAPPPYIRTARLGRGVMGLWDQATRTIWLDADLTSAEQRCTLVHELVHAERGDIPCGDPALGVRQERRVEREAARRLIALSDLVEAVRWSREELEVAELLDVDPPTLRARLDGLSDAERRALRLDQDVRPDPGTNGDGAMRRKGSVAPRREQVA